MRLPIILAAAALLAPLPAAAQKWYRMSATDKAAIYVDLDSLVIDGDIVRGTTMIVYRGLFRDTTAKYTTYQGEYNCANGRMRFPHWIVSDQKGSTLQISGDKEGQLHTADPGSSGEKAYNFICNIDRSYGAFVADPLRDIATAPADH